MAVDLLHALHENSGLYLYRVGDRLGLAPNPPEEVRLTLSRHKLALLRALEEGERVEAAALLRDPHRLAALLAHALGGEAPVVLTGYYEGPPTRYLVAVDRLTPYLAWAALPLPRRLHLAALDGRWAVDVVGGWEVALEAVVAGTRHVLLYPEDGARGWLEAARAGLALHEVSVWRPGAAPRPLLLTAA
ncbi:hypothetical protein TthHB5008_08900 [Thermus thermophilus]|uniref:hypothetical protein n=1 Tax=Thermus thermophilus TaxID=274 RepID=UPI00194E1B31|nr:hypothetical protein [Thermus thermophilus]BCP97789.1 hypothetical protein TthHB5002_08920 [Thermus thermophilus]BCQ00120.1 hypothetical protein TthHB5008_08900 [Thermus thermophilus]